MPSAPLKIKRQNHRLHPCPAERKPELLTLLLDRYKGEEILVVTAGDTEPLRETAGDAETVIDDAELAADPGRRCGLLISYDLPDQAAAYMERLSRTDGIALLLLAPEEQARLYPIETLLGRTILQETIGGFETEAPAAPRRKTDRKEKSSKARKGKHPAEKRGKKQEKAAPAKATAKRPIRRITLKSKKAQ